MALPRTRLFNLFVIAIIAILIVVVVLAQHDSASQPQPSEQVKSASTLQPTQDNEEAQGDTPMQPDINNDSFKITTSNVSCATSTVNGETVRSCSGNIHIVPATQPDHSAGLYKVNEQTKLLHGEQEEDLNNLQQLSQDQTVVRLKLQDGSEDTLKEIRY